MVSPQQCGQEIIENEDYHARYHHSPCRGLAHSFRAALRIKPFITADDSDNGPEHQCFDQSVPDVTHHRVIDAVFNVNGGVRTEHFHSYKISADDTSDHAQNGEKKTS